jgi:outer membrane protein assembly factor BamE
MQLLINKMSCNKIFCFATLVSTILLTACASKAPIASTATVSQADNSDTKVIAPTGLNKVWTYISPYKITVQQGNFVSQEAVSQLKHGMTREQVRFLLGTALLTDMFHEDRWDYPFRLLKPNGELISSRLSITFKNNNVAHFEGAKLPSEKEYLAYITESAISIKVEASPISNTSDSK